MQIVQHSHPWHIECKCFETGIVTAGDPIPDKCAIWLEGDDGDTVVFRRVARNPDCSCSRCKLTMEQHVYFDKIEGR